jgi:DNA-directed RNA polymerase specialized sigma24 family protein
VPFRHRPEYDETVPARLRAAREAYDSGLAEVRREWADALAAAIDAGMSYDEISAEAGVSASTIRAAVKSREA